MNVSPVYIPGLTAAAVAPMQAYNIQQVTKRQPHKTSAGAALEQLGDALDKRVAEILLQALRGTTTVCAVALETHEGVIDLGVSDDGDGAEGSPEGSRSGIH